MTLTITSQILVQGAVGFLIGAGTNDLAIRWIFNTVFSKKKKAIAQSVKEVISTELMTPEKLAARVGAPDVKAAFERDVRRKIDGVLDRAESVVNGFGSIFSPLSPRLVKEEVEAIAKVAALFDAEVRSMVARMCADRIVAYMGENMPRILAETDIWSVVYDSIVGYDEAKMEFLTRKIANRELRGVTLAGGMIGALVGVSMAVVMWFIN
jgi:uncharacterized membrane protein YheB (UPF0754 family)